MHIQKVGELGLDHGVPTAKTEVTYLGITFRRTLESLFPDLYGPPESKVVESASEKGVQSEPVEEPGSFDAHAAKDAGAGLSNDHKRAHLESVQISPCSPQDVREISPAVSAPTYLVLYPPEAVGVYVGSGIKIQLLYPGVFGEACVLSKGRLCLTQEKAPQKYYNVI